MSHRVSRMRHDGGFSLSELMVALLLIGIMGTLAAGSIRNLWFSRALDGAADEIVSRLRQSQEDAVSESAPLVFGVRVTPGSSTWTLFRYDPNWNSGAGRCVGTNRTFGGGTFSAPVVVGTVTITNDTTSSEHVKCRASATDKILFFYARGSSTGGSFTLEQPNIDRTVVISVSGLTGRITRS